MKTGAVVVAAGMSSRMNDFKPMMKNGSITIINRVITTLKQAGVDIVVVITGFQSKMLEKHLSKENIICLYNENYETTEMLDSAKIGLQYLMNKWDKILFTPADIPLFSVHTVKKLLKRRAPSFNRCETNSSNIIIQRMRRIKKKHFFIQKLN